MEDIAIGLKQMFLSAGMWQLSLVSVPSSMPTPTQSAESLNDNLLRLCFGPALSGIPPRPQDCQLYVHDPNMKGKVWKRINGAPPGQLASFFFDAQPYQTWYLQGKGQWAYAMTKTPNGMKLDWVRRSDYGVLGEGAEFEVTGVLPAESPGLQGIHGYHYVDGIYVAEAGVEKVLFVALQKPVDYSRGQRSDPAKLHLFACQAVAPTMHAALATRCAMGQNFEPRRGQPGYVMRGRLPFQVDPSGYVWQEANGGAIYFWHQADDGAVLEFKQWGKDLPVFIKTGADGTGWAQVRPATGQWQHADVKDWVQDIVSV